jgi:hypothetical protein
LCNLLLQAYPHHCQRHQVFSTDLLENARVLSLGKHGHRGEICGVNLHSHPPTRFYK